MEIILAIIAACLVISLVANNWPFVCLMIMVVLGLAAIFGLVVLALIDPWLLVLVPIVLTILWGLGWVSNWMHGESK